MMQRVWSLTTYFTKSLFFSLTGLILLILTLVYWVIFFPPGQGTPDVENYVILIGAFGAAATFLAHCRSAVAPAGWRTTRYWYACPAGSSIWRPFCSARSSSGWACNFSWPGWPSFAARR